MEISELRDEFLLCRTLGHAWDDNPTAEVDSQLFKASQGCLALRCTRCATERFDYLDNSMGVFTRYYRYPQGYEGVKRGEEEGLAPQFRAEMFSRSILIRKTQERRLRKVS
jgi:hypothetical protein